MAAQTLSVLALSTTASPSGCSKPGKSSSLLFPRNLKSGCLVNSFLGHNLLIGSSNLRSLVPKRQRSALTISLSLPTAKPERALAEKIPKWSVRAIRAYALAEIQALKLNYSKKGTESLLMGILVEGTSHAAKFLRANGITLLKVREETLKLLGKSSESNRKTLYPPLTEPAQRALDWAVDEKLKSGETGEITTTHMLLGIWSEKEYAGHKVMAALGFDDEKAKELAKFANEDVVLSAR